MPDGVYADAWLVITPLRQHKKLGEKLIIPCEDVYEARSMQHMLCVAGAPRKCVVVSGGGLPARPPEGGRYRIITVEEALRVTVDVE